MKANATTLRRSLILSYAAIVVLLTTVLLGLTIFAASTRAEEESQRLLRHSMGYTESHLHNFFRPVHVLTNLGREWGVKAVDDGGATFVASVASGIALPQISAVRVERLGSWNLEDFDGQKIRWSRPKLITTTCELEMTAFTPVIGSDGTAHLIAVDVSLEALSEFTRSFRVTEHSKVVALIPRLPPSKQKAGETPEAIVIGLPSDPRFEDPAARRAAYLQPGKDLDVGVWKDAIAPLFARGEAARAEPIRFESGGAAWWGGFWNYPLDPDLPLHLAILIPESDLVGDYQRLQIYLALGAALAFALALLFAARLSRRAGRPIEALVEQTDRIKNGDLSPGLAISSRLIEVQRLAEALEDMRVGLESLTRMEHEFKVARDVQQATFPTEMPLVDGYELFGSSVPAEATGGDTLALIQRDEESQNDAVLMLADATGHGIGPALSVAHLHAMLRMAVRSGTRLEALVRDANAQLLEDLPAGRFITAWFGVLRADRNELQCFSCGQGPIFHYHAREDRFEEMKSQSPPLGILEIEVILPPAVTLEPGDLYIVLSDGFHEAIASGGELFEVERVQDVIRDRIELGPKEIIEALHTAVNAFTGQAPADDDRTCVIVKRVRGST